MAFPRTFIPFPLFLLWAFVCCAQEATPNPAAQEQGVISEEQLRHELLGKPLYLRGFYLDNTLAFNEHGKLIGHSPVGSYTLSAVQFDHLRLTKHKLELEGARYGLHFVGQLAYEDPATGVDRVRITPKKKFVRVTIDREIVVSPKKNKEKKPTTKIIAAPKPSASGQTAPLPAAEASDEPSAEEQAKAQIAAAPEVERPADPKSLTTTTSPAHAAQVLRDALDAVLAPGLDERMMAHLPDFWKLYYEAAAAKADYRPKDPSVLRQATVDTKARLITNFEPPSNEYAQANAVAGMALYHTVVGANGKAGEIAVARPIGFGLDENAVEAIRKASFQPAIKDGKPVAVMIDLVVQFRIYSNRTSQVEKPEPDASDSSTKPVQTPVLPGPYSIPR